MGKFRKFDEELIKETVSMRELLEYHGVEFNRNGRFSCICPEHVDSDPSSVILEDKRTYCHSCKETYDVINAEKVLSGCSWQQAGFNLCEIFGIPLVEGTPDRRNTEKLLPMEDRELIGLAGNSSPVFKTQIKSLGIIVGISEEKTSSAYRYDPDVDGYLIEKSTPMSLRKLMQEDRKLYYEIIANKAVEARANSLRMLEAISKPNNTEFSKTLCRVVNSFPMENPIPAMIESLKEDIARCEEIYYDYKKRYEKAS